MHLSSNKNHPKGCTFAGIDVSKIKQEAETGKKKVVYENKKKKRPPQKPEEKAEPKGIIFILGTIQILFRLSLFVYLLLEELERFLTYKIQRQCDL